MNIDDFLADIEVAKAALDDLGKPILIPVKIANDEALTDLATKEWQLRQEIQPTADALRDQGRAVAEKGALTTSLSRRITTLIAREEALRVQAKRTTDALMDQAMAFMIADSAGVSMLQPVVKAEQDAAKGGGGGGGGGGNGWWGLLASVPLWGGAFGSTKLLGALPAWHLALSGLIDMTIGLVSASIALGAALASMEPAAQDIYNRFTALHDVAVALNGGQGIPPLTGWFERLQHALAGNTIGAYGGLVNLLSGSATSQTASTIKQISDGLDTWIAKLDIYRQSQGNANSILQHGLGYAGQFETVLDALGKSFVNLLHAEPGTVHYLLDITEGFAQGIQWVTHFGTAVKVALGAHAFLAYGGTLYTGVKWLLGKLPLVGKYIATAMENPFVAGATMAVAGLVLWWTRATSSIQNYIRAQNAALAGMSPEQAFNNIPKMIQGIEGQIPGLHNMVLKDWNDPSKVVRAWGYQFEEAWKDFTSGPTSGNPLRSLTRTFLDLLSPSSGQNLAQQDYLNKVRGQVQSLSGDWVNLYSAAAPLVKQGYSMQQAFALESMAGVKANDTYAQMQQKIKNLITGYGDLGNSAGFLTNSINATDFAAEQQNSKITAVTQGWQAFIGMLTGGANAFGTFEQQMIGLMQTTGTAATTIRVSNGKVSASTTATASGVSASIDGMTSSTLQMYNTFTTGISDASDMLNQLYELDSAASMGKHGVDLLSRAGKDLVAQLLPMASGSQLLTTMLYGLAQQGGYKGADSFKALATWVGNAKNPVKDLLGILTTFEVQAGNLGTDVKNLAEAINPSMTSAINNSIIAATGGTKVMENWAYAVLIGYGNSKLLTNGAEGLWQQMVLVYGHTAAAKDQFEAFAIRLGISQKAADQLWNDLEASGGRSTAAVLRDIANIQAALDGLHDKTITITAITQAVSGGGNYGPYSGGYRTGGGTPSGSTGHLFGAPSINLSLDGRQIARSMAQRATTTQRRTGTNGYMIRTR